MKPDSMIIGGYVWQALRMAFPSSVPVEGRLVLVLDAYFDESGTDATSPVLTVAGYVAPPDQWVSFEQEWSEALRDFGLDHFHMTDFSVGAPPYKEWSKELKQERLTRLFDIISRHSTYCIGVSVQKSLYESCVTPELRRVAGGLYGVASTNCATRLATVLREAEQEVGRDTGEEAAQPWVAYIFEAGALGAAQAMEPFAVNVKRERFRILSARLENKKRFLPLQAADILAYELNTAYRRQIGMETRPQRIDRLVPLATTPGDWCFLGKAALLDTAKTLPLYVQRKRPGRQRKRSRK